MLYVAAWCFAKQRFVHKFTIILVLNQLNDFSVFFPSLADRFRVVGIRFVLHAFLYVRNGDFLLRVWVRACEWFESILNFGEAMMLAAALQVHHHWSEKFHFIVAIILYPNVIACTCRFAVFLFAVQSSSVRARVAFTFMAITCCGLRFASWLLAPLPCQQLKR